MLRSHPSIVRCDKKEPGFFCTCKDWRKEICDYHSLYQWKEGALHFEASTSYTFYPHRNLNVWKNLFAYNADLKIIYIVRNPIERIISAYMHLYERGFTNLGIQRAIIKKPGLLNITRYATQIRPFLEEFGVKQVRILFFEDLIKDQTLIRNQLCDFLDISIDGFSDVSQIHANKTMGSAKKHHKYDDPGIILDRVRKYVPFVWNIITDNTGRCFDKKPVLPGRFQEMILFLLRKEIDELEAMTDRNLDIWREIK